MSKKQLNITDNIKIDNSTRVITDEGYLQGIAAITKVGVQAYRLSELTGLDSDFDKIVSVFRPPETVFHENTSSSARMKPMTITHPDENVVSDNYSKYSIGSLGDNTTKLDSERLGINYQIINKSAIDIVKDNKMTQVSLGYGFDYKKQEGEYKGSTYQYVFDGPMIINHCSLVTQGRCGSDVSILDKQIEVKKDMTLQDIKDKMLEDAEFAKELKSLLVDSDETIADAELVELNTDDSETILDAEPVELTVSDTAIQDAVSVRLSIIDKARHILKDEDILELSNREILVKSMQDSIKDIESKSDDYLLGMLDSSIAKHTAAKQQYKDISVNDSQVEAHYFSPLEIKNMKQRG